jgi:hypothetical protein
MSRDERLVAPTPSKWQLVALLRPAMMTCEGPLRGYERSCNGHRRRGEIDPKRTLQPSPVVRPATLLFDIFGRLDMFISTERITETSGDGSR